jgi:hypothetical protein
MLADHEVRRLLDTLCVDLGFCLRPAEIERLVGDPPKLVVTFTDEVFRSEGMDPGTVDRHLYRQVRDVVAAAFDQAEAGEEADPG